MKYKDLRDFISFLESRGELKRIKAPVSCELEIAEVCDRVVKRGGPALLFENVEGYDIPVLINMFGTERRMAWALGVEAWTTWWNRCIGSWVSCKAPLRASWRKCGPLVNW